MILIDLEKSDSTAARTAAHSSTIVLPLQRGATRSGLKMVLRITNPTIVFPTFDAGFNSAKIQNSLCPGGGGGGGVHGFSNF